MDHAVYYKFRYTFSQEEDEEFDESAMYNFEIETSFFINLFKNYYYDKMTTGIEYKDKFGNRTWAHLHIHFSSKTKKDTIVKQLKRKFKEEFSEDLIGNKKYCLSIETYINEEKFYRYPLKQGLNLKFVDKHRNEELRQFGFTNDELNLMYEKANDCWMIGQEVANKKQEHKEDSDTLYDRLLTNYKKNPKTLEIEILAQIFEFYQIEKRSININTCKGYVYNIMLDAGLITSIELAGRVLGV